MTPPQRAGVARDRSPAGRRVARPALAAWAGLALAAPDALRAQENAPLVGDRPDFTESPCVVPSPQLEAGYTWARASEAIDEHAIGEVLLRVPLGRRFEARIGLGSYVAIRGPMLSESGYGGSSVGLKWAVAEASGRAPDIALILGTTIATGARPVGGDEWVPELRVAAGWDGDVSFGSNLGVLRSESATGRRTQVLGSAVVGLSFGDRLGAFGETYAVLGGDDEWVVDGGVTLLLAPGYQLDARVGASLDLDRTEPIVGIGLVARP